MSNLKFMLMALSLNMKLYTLTIYSYHMANHPFIRFWMQHIVQLPKLYHRTTHLHLSTLINTTYIYSLECLGITLSHKYHNCSRIYLIFHQLLLNIIHLIKLSPYTPEINIIINYLSQFHHFIKFLK